MSRPWSTSPAPGARDLEPILKATAPVLDAVADRQAAKYHEKAYRRREVAVAEPRVHVTGWVPSPHGEVEARALLELLWEVHPRERGMLILVGEGGQVSEIARSLGMPVATAFSRLRRGRLRLATVLKRRRYMSI